MDFDFEDQSGQRNLNVDVSIQKNTYFNSVEYILKIFSLVNILMFIYLIVSSITLQFMADTKRL